ncbi:competence type IV pilus minor pilin ComGD [Ornithinibacillus scapharcae]|uniref:competence type IV pilus minor pilin ComGD n=1 Tax=Ornithinibacillus scapharcae TaxID=1147159 RepID=UPI000225B0F2|nr:competence type IV pilus minor pilin ComGD [Ornithinibacillus scapharcae]
MHQKQKQTKQYGFTLIELLAVLSIVAIILTITIPTAIGLLEKKTEEKVLQQFQYDILFLQNESIGQERYLRMFFSDGTYQIIDNQKQLLERKLPDGWEIKQRTLDNISFNQNGTIRKAGTLQIRSPKNQYNIIFPLGKGRGYIVKQ